MKITAYVCNQCGKLEDRPGKISGLVTKQTLLEVEAVFVDLEKTSVHLCTDCIKEQIDEPARAQEIHNSRNKIKIDTPFAEYRNDYAVLVYINLSREVQKRGQEAVLKELRAKRDRK